MYIMCVLTGARRSLLPTNVVNDANFEKPTQLPGLVKPTSMRHQEHQKGHQAHEKVHVYMVSCATPALNKWITSIQPPGLMKMRLMHHPQCHACMPGQDRHKRCTPPMSKLKSLDGKKQSC